MIMSLGIESSSHTFGVGIADENGNILANEKSIYVPPRGSGIIPKEAANFHLENAKEILQKALHSSKLKMDDIIIISIALGAGLPPCLRVGADFSKVLALNYKKILVPVCHQIAHIEIGKLTTEAKDPVVLYLSGGNTQIIAYVEGRYRVFGETQDIPIGNALDVVARGMKLDLSKVSGGVAIENLAKKGEYIELPYVVKGVDLSFSGIETDCIRKFKNGARPEDVAYSMQETCFAMLTEVTERVMAHTDKRELMLVGGVAANKRLQEMLRMMTEEREAKFFVVPQEYAGDQGAMIAWTGIMAQRKGYIVSADDVQIKQKWRIDEVEW